jgi:hypothetical protein
VKRRFSFLLALVVVAFAPAAAHAQSCPVPADNAPRADIAGWMAEGATAAGLPGELPVMASLVDAGLTNLNGGDRDSVGYFAMRVGIWDNGKYAGFPDNPALQLQWFIDQALIAKAQRIAAGLPVDDPNRYGDWVADVMRPAEEFRGRYQLRLDEARQLIAQGCADAPPVVALSVSPQAGQGGWLNEAATVAVAASDDRGVTGLVCAVDQIPRALAGDTLTIGDDGAHAVSCTATDTAGHTSVPATVTVKVDRTAPTIAFTGNASSYDVDATVAIACAANDALSGLDDAATSCAPISGPAYGFALGTNTFTALATDVAGNQATASTSFDVHVSSGGLGALTADFVQDSSAYRALRPAQRLAVDRLLAALSRSLSDLTPRLTPAQRRVLIRAYQAGVAALVGPGWLTAEQAATLQRLAGAL